VIGLREWVHIREEAQCTEGEQGNTPYCNVQTSRADRLHGTDLIFFSSTYHDINLSICDIKIRVKR